MIVAEFAAVVVIAYLLGSIPFGLIIARIARGVDVRRFGSTKTGGANVMRAAGTKAGILTIALDIGKAAAAVLIAKAIVSPGTIAVSGTVFQYYQIAQVIAGLAVLAGHIWSVFLKFKGGRGVASFFGTLIPLFPPAAIFGGGVLAVVAKKSRYISLGSIIAALATWCLLAPLTVLVPHTLPPIYLAYSLAAVALIVYQHRGNIKRLQQGTERRLGDKSEEIS